MWQIQIGSLKAAHEKQIIGCLAEDAPSHPAANMHDLYVNAAARVLPDNS